MMLMGSDEQNSIQRLKIGVFRTEGFGSGFRV